MLFEAELRENKYQITVDKIYPFWEVSISKDGHDPKVYKIPQNDFQEADSVVSFLFKGKSYLLDVLGQGTEYDVYTRGSYRTVNIFNDEMLLHESLKTGGQQGSGAGLVSGMPGKIVKVMVKAGQEVKAGDPLLVMEAMKMENEMKATADAVIKSVEVGPGDSVESGTLMISFEV